jgi:RNA polymerase sigma factor
LIEENEVQYGDHGDLDNMILEAAKSSEAVESLLKKHTRYVHSRVQKFAMGVSADVAEELFSVGFSAFYEAMQSYKIDKGHFYPFADVVIHRRIIDELRKLQRQDNNALSLDEIEDEFEESQQINEVSGNIYRLHVQNETLIAEIESFTEELALRKISMDDLVLHAPKQASLRNEYAQIVHAVLTDALSMDAIHKKNYYPVKRIADITKLSQKKVDRSRIYVLAVIIVATGEYEVLKEYFPFLKAASFNVACEPER